LLLVVVMMSILTGGVVVSLSGSTERYAVRVAAHDLAAAVRFAAGEARRRKCPVRLTFADDGRAFTIEAREDVTGTFKPVEGAAGALRRFPPAVRVGRTLRAEDGTNGAITGLEFGPNGAGFVGHIQIEGRDHSVTSVRVWPQTGEAYVETPELRGSAANASER
jgi:type II secretory pathway pseudopilin PulG